MNHYNLIDERWINTASHGKVSLADVFTTPTITGLSGRYFDTFPTLRLLLAIVQSAYTPSNERERRKLGIDGMVKNVVSHLHQHHDAFYLYGESPFLQMTGLVDAKLKRFGVVMPGVMMNSRTRLTDAHYGHALDDSDKALMVVRMAVCALGGKQMDNSVVLTPDYPHKTRNGKPMLNTQCSPANGGYGYLHSFVVGPTLLDTLYLNWLTEKEIEATGLFDNGVGAPPWVSPVIGEACDNAKMLQTSYMGRLLPMAHFCLLDTDGIRITEGIRHLGVHDGMFDLSMTTGITGNKRFALKNDLVHTPWQHLGALLAFIDANQHDAGCLQLKFGLKKAKIMGHSYGVWCMGVKLSNQSGEQYFSAGDDTIDSRFVLPSTYDKGQWFEIYQEEIADLKSVERKIAGAIKRYFKLHKNREDDDKRIGQSQANNAVAHFWRLCNRHAQALINDCEDIEKIKAHRRRFTHYAHATFEQFCHLSRAKPDLVERCRPQLYQYMKKEK